MKPAIQIDDPLLQRGNAAGLLRAERAAVEGLVEGDDHVLGAAARFHAVRAAQLDGALHRFRAGGQQEDLLQRLGQNGDELFHQARADLARKAIVGEQVRRRPARRWRPTISWRPWPALAISTPDDQSIHWLPQAS